MSGTTAIQWTDTTWNPGIYGCDEVSPGCANCYAAVMAHRLAAMGKTGYTPDLTRAVPAGGRAWTGEVRAFEDEALLEAPLRWRKPRRVFVNSMSDLFHEDVPFALLDRIFAVMALTTVHTYQVLTKRPERMREYLTNEATPFRVSRAMVGFDGPASLDEQVKAIDGFPGYFASTRGIIYSEQRGRRRALRPDTGDQGHQRVQLHRDGSGRRGERLLVHRLILETFDGPAPDAHAQGRHLDGDPTNNAISNLAWGTPGENWSDSKRHGTHRRYSKLTQEQVVAIRTRWAAGETAAALGREFEISDTQVRNIGRGEQWNVEPPISWPLPSVWLGVSAEDQERAEERIPLLLDTPAAVRFVSYEPAVESVNFRSLDVERHGPGWYWLDALTGRQDDMGRPCPDAPARLDWIIVGGESGPQARPFDLAWARSVVSQCRQAGVAVFMKQLGRRPFSRERGVLVWPEYPLRDLHGGDMAEWPEDLRVREFPAVAGVPA